MSGKGSEIYRLGEPLTLEEMKAKGLDLEVIKQVEAAQDTARHIIRLLDPQKITSFPDLFKKLELAMQQSQESFRKIVKNIPVIIRDDDPLNLREAEKRLAGPTLEVEAIIATRQWKANQEPTERGDDG